MSEQQSAALDIAREAVDLYVNGAPKDQLAAKCFDAAICLSFEAIGPIATIEGLLAVLAMLREECPKAFAAIEALHKVELEQCGQA
jgi:hypothetical protein